jgi:hypothetical protein
MLLRPRREAEDHVGARNRGRENLVVVGHFGEPRDQRIVGGDALHVLDQARRRRAIRVDEQNVEGDRRDAKLVQPVDQLRQQRPRPGPLAEPCQGVVIDIDDAHRRRLVYPRFETQELVEHI